jgi:hypothetical protein
VLSLGQVSLGRRRRAPAERTEGVASLIDRSLESYLSPTSAASAAAGVGIPAPRRTLRSLPPPVLLLRRWPSSTPGRSSRRSPDRCRCCSARNTGIRRERGAETGRWPHRSRPSSTAAAAAAAAPAEAAAAFFSTAAAATAATNVRQIDNLNTCQPYLSRSLLSCRTRCWRAAGGAARPFWPTSWRRTTTGSDERDPRGWHCGGRSVWRSGRQCFKLFYSSLKPSN